MGIETLAAIGLGLSAGVSAIGAIQQGQQQKQISEYNARVAEQNAAAAKAQAALDEENIRVRTRAIQGTVRARAGAAGVDLGGSPLDLLASNASEAELEALAARYAGETAASRYTSQAALERAMGKTAETRGYFGAAANLLSAAGSAYKAYGPFTAAGGPSLSTTVPYRLDAAGRVLGGV